MTTSRLSVVVCLLTAALTSSVDVQRSEPQVAPPRALRLRALPPGVATMMKPRPAKHPKLTTVLADLARAVPQQRGAIPQGQRIAPPPGFSVEALPKSCQDAIRAGTMRINKDAEVQVYVQVTEVTDENLQQLQATGATVELHDKQQRIVQARIPVARLEEVAALPFVRFIRLPDYGVPQTGSVTTEGDAILKTDQVRSLLGVDGTGVRVGVISDGIAGIFATGCTSCGALPGGPIATGDLPNATGTRNAGGILTSSSGGLIAQSFRADMDLEAGLGGNPTGAEGTAMVEIVHDLAPSAQLLFANFATSLEFNAAVNLLAANSDVVVDDIGFFARPYDGTSDVSTNTASALNNDANPIRAYFTSVGNGAREHYQEDFLDSGLDGDVNFGLGQPGNVHLFQATANTDDALGLGPSPFDLVFLCGTSNPTVCSGVPPGSSDTVRIFLVWDDAFGASGNNYDLFLVEESTGNVVAFSNDVQDGNDFPVEIFTFTNTGTEGFFRIFIQDFNNLAAAVNFDVFVLEPNGKVIFASTGENHNFNTIPSSVTAQSDTGGSPVSVISVGAIDQADPGNDDIEPFSSNGPTNDGRLKPDVSAIDGVSVTGAGGFSTPFFGTSAAAPHGAGVAALLLQLAPCFRDGTAGARSDVDARTILRSLILNNAVDLGAPAADNIFGTGRIDALASANLTIPTANAGPDETVTGTSASGASVTLNGSASSDPNTCPLTFNWTGGCGGASGANPAVTCPLGVNSVNLRVTNNGVTLSSTDSVQITVTDFSTNLSPASVTIRPGQTATYTVTVTPQFGPFGNAVSLSCSGLPALTSCSFSPASTTPGANPATSTLTVTTTASSASLTPSLWQHQNTPLYALWLGIPGVALLGLALARPNFRKQHRAPRPALSEVEGLPPGGKVQAPLACPRPHLYLLFSLLLAFLALQAACGGGGGTPPAPRPGTPTGTHNITITGTSGSLQRSITATLIVQ